MTKNTRSFWTWQGNVWFEPGWMKWAIFLLGFLVLTLIWVFKDNINKRHNNGRNILFFKTKETYFQAIGIVLLTVYMFKWILFIISGYPMYWETLNLHLCRILALMIFSILAFKKFELIKYLSYLAIVGFIFGVGFAGAASDFINNLGDYQSLGGSDLSIVNGALEDSSGNKIVGDVINKITGEKHYITILERIFMEKGYTFYHVGLDSFHFYESYGLHLAILWLPAYTMISFSYKFSVIELHRISIYGIACLVVVWTLNVILGHVPDIRWRSNFWYVGLDENNDMKDAIGILSGWPQNFFTYGTASVVIPSFMHFIYIIQDKLMFFQDGKFLQKRKSIKWEEAKAEYRKGFKTVINEAVTGKWI